MDYKIKLNVQVSESMRSKGLQQIINEIVHLWLSLQFGL